MSAVEEVLGVDLHNPAMLRARELVENDRRLIDDLVRVRAEKGLSQEDVGRLMGVSQPTVAAFEREDSNPKMSTIRRYAHALGVTVRHEVVFDSSLRTTPPLATTPASVPSRHIGPLARD